MLEGDANQPGEPGNTIGSYRIIRPLGAGGMSAVFLARHEVTGVEVAIKVLPREMAKKPMILRRFLREAKNAEALQHPHIAAIYDRGEERGRHYLVLEYVDGGDLHERVRADGPLDPGPALDLTRTVAEGLSYAAGRGVIHRDIKPANLLVTPAGTAKIIDLGLALQTIEDDERVTRDGTTVGTVDFMAPEQARDSRGASARSDIYSLGCTLYYLLTGSPPYPGGTITEKLGRIVGEPPPDPRALRGDLPAPVALLVLRMMAKRPEDRFDDYDGLIAAIDSARVDLELAPASVTFDLANALEDDADFGESGSFLLDDDHEEAEPDALPNAQVPAAGASPPAIAFATEDEAIPATGAVDGLPPAETSGRVRDPSARAAIGAGLAIGLILAVFGVAVRELSRDRNPVAVAEPIPDESDGPFEPGPRPARPAPPPPIPEAVAAESPPTWVEPKETSAGPPDSAGWAPAPAEERLFPAWTRDKSVERADGPSVSVRRIMPAGSRTKLDDLTRAFEIIGGTVVIDGDGPFFEDGFRVAGKTRVVRAGPGVRPIVVIRPAGLGPGASAVAVLDGKSLTLIGLDLVIDLEGASPGLDAFFACRDARITLRDCTLTLANAARSPFALVRFGLPDELRTGGNPSRILLDRCSVRGPNLIVARWEGGGGEVAAIGSTLYGESGPIFEARDPGSSPAATPRSAILGRCLLTGRGPIIVSEGDPGAMPEIRSAGSTWARLEGGVPTAMIQIKGKAPNDPVAAWSGDGNAFEGWSSRLAVGPDRSPRILNLASARATWPDADGSSTERLAAWPSRSADAPIEELARLAPDLAPTFASAARPSPRLAEKTIGSFARLAIPPRVAPKDGNPGAAATDGPAPGSSRPPIEPGVVALDFDAEASPWFGNLGRFLAEQAPRGSVRVVVRGGGPKPCAPIVVAPGTRMTIEVAPPGTSASASEPLSWHPEPGTGDRPLIAARDADLTLIQVRLRGDGRSDRGGLVLVEGGHLELDRCQLQAYGQAGAGLAPLVVFRSLTTRPLPTRAGPSPFIGSSDRPTCLLADSLLATGGVAIEAELGRGVVALTHCALAAGEAVLSLRPGHVRRDRFEADVQIDRSTLVAARAVVRLANWPGADPGPDRPWLISTRRTAFFDAAPRARRAAAMLEADPLALSRATLAWQGDGDAYELVRFAATSGSTPPETLKPDVRRRWVDLWGPRHIRNASGPSPSRIGPGLRLLVEQVATDRATPGDFLIDPTSADDRRGQAIGVDLARFDLGRTPAPNRRR